MNYIKRNLLIILAVFIAMCLLGVYHKLTYIPIQNPTDDVDLRAEGAMYVVWFAFTLIFNIALFLVLSMMTSLVGLIKHLRKTSNE